MSSTKKWMLTALAIPTFYMPLVYCFGCVAAIVFLSVGSHDSPEWLRHILLSGICVSALLWPVYFVWAIGSSLLTRKEKVKWVLLIFFMNMVGMPIFFVFMMYKYSGREPPIIWMGRGTSEKDIKATHEYLQSLGASRDWLMDNQWNAIAKSVGIRRINKKLRIASVIIILGIFGSVVFMSLRLVSPSDEHLAFFGRSLLVKTVFTDKEGSTVVSEPVVEHVRLVVWVPMIIGANFGLLGGVSIFSVLISLRFHWRSAPENEALDGVIREMEPGKTSENSLNENQQDIVQRYRWRRHRQTWFRIVMLFVVAFVFCAAMFWIPQRLVEGHMEKVATRPLVAVNEYKEESLIGLDEIRSFLKQAFMSGILAGVSGSCVLFFLINLLPLPFLKSPDRRALDTFISMPSAT